MEKPDQNGAESERSKKDSFLTPARLKLDSQDSSDEGPVQSSTPKVVLRPSALAVQTEKLKTQNTESLKLGSDSKDSSVKNGSPTKSENSQEASGPAVSKSDGTLPLAGAAPFSESISLKCAKQSTVASEPATFGLFSANCKDSNSNAGGFVFGQNLHERALNYDPGKSAEAHSSLASTDLTFESVKKEDEPQMVENEPKSGVKRTLSDAAKEYESKKVKTVLEHVSVITGEEGEYNVLQINCKLFYFDNEKKNYHERGRGILRLNDKELDGVIQSRVVMRTQGSLRVILNTKIWSGMTVEHVSEKTIRMTALDLDGLKVFLIMCSAKDSQQLFSALQCRISNLKSREEAANKNCVANDSSIDESASLSSTLDISSNDSFQDYSRQCFGSIKVDIESPDNISIDFTSPETKHDINNSINSSNVTNH